MVGGMETYVLQLIENLPENRFNVVCLCPSESAFTTRLREIGCTVYITPFADEPDFLSLQIGTALIESEKIDIIHAHLPNAHLLAGILSKLTQTPALATIHGRCLFMRDLEIHRMMHTEICVVSKSAYFHALSLGITSKNLKYIPNGVDSKIFHPACKSDYLHSKINVEPGTPLIGFIGRLSYEKGPEVFLRAAKIAHAKIPACHFVLVGEGPMRERLEHEISALGLSGFVHLAGLQGNMPKIYSSLELSVSTSYSEGMPLAVIEAMASGLPVIATQVGGVVDVIEVGVTGFLNMPGDDEGVARNMAAIMTNPKLRKSMGKAGHKRAKEKFDLKNSVDQTARLLMSLHSSGRSRPLPDNATLIRPSVLPMPRT